jgi:hypothetical protein
MQGRSTSLGDSFLFSTDHVSLLSRPVQNSSSELSLSPMDFEFGLYYEYNDFTIITAAFLWLYLILAPVPEVSQGSFICRIAMGRAAPASQLLVNCTCHWRRGSRPLPHGGMTIRRHVCACLAAISFSYGWKD